MSDGARHGFAEKPPPFRTQDSGERAIWLISEHANLNCDQNSGLAATARKLLWDFPCYTSSTSPRLGQSQKRANTQTLIPASGGVVFSAASVVSEPSLSGATLSCFTAETPSSCSKSSFAGSKEALL